MSTLGELVLFPVNLATLPQPPRSVNRRSGGHGVTGESALVDPHFVAVVVRITAVELNATVPNKHSRLSRSQTLIHSLDAIGGLAVLGGALLAKQDAVERVSGGRPTVE